MAKVTPGVSDIGTKASIPQTDLFDVVDDATVTNIVEADISSTSTLITIASTAPSNPKTGQGWRDTSVTPFLTKFWDGSAWAAEGVSVSDTAPSSPGVGQEWYDTTLDIKRHYEVKNGITGWHPIDNGLELMTNDSGATVGAGRAAVRHNSGTGVSEFTTTTIVKDQSVYGVTLESIDNGSSGIVAKVTSGRVVEIYQDGSTYALARGDGIVTDGTAGQSRGVGPLAINGYQSARGRIIGTPIGCFAEAIDTSSALESVTCRLLGYVGQGATAVLGDYGSALLSSCPSTGTTAGSWTGQDIASDLLDAHHEPCSHAIVHLTGTGAISGGTAEIRMALSSDGSTEDVRMQYEGGPSGGNVFEATGEAVIGTVDSVSSPTKMGTEFAGRMHTPQGGSGGQTMTIALKSYVY